MAIILPSILEAKTAGLGIDGILYAAPIADLVAVIIVIRLSISFFSSLSEEESRRNADCGEYSYNTN